MTWWCSAQGQAWTWTWQPYIGVWLLIAVFVTAYALAFRRLRPPNTPEAQRSPKFIVRTALGLLVFWIAADWPVGALGAGYLLSVHTLQYVLFVFVVPPLIISGAPQWMLRRAIRGRTRLAIARIVTHPLIAFVIFNLVMLGTHFPAVVDGLTTSQLGSFAVNMTWLVSGFVFWWPVLGPLPELRPLPYPGRLLYLLANIFIPTIPASFMTFADYPLYALYELAPRVSGLSATEDQQLAGIIMKLLGGFIIFGTGTVLFFRWWSADAADDDLDGSRPPNGPDDGNDDDPGDPTFDPGYTPAEGRRPAVVSST